MPNDGSLRLFGGTAYSGNVEIFYSFTWFSICQRGWSDPDAHVVCRQLGMEPGTKWNSSVPARNGSQMLLIDVGCTGNEKRLSDCTLPLVSNGNTCSAEGTAAVLCKGMAIHLL